MASKLFFFVSCMVVFVGCSSGSDEPRVDDSEDALRRSKRCGGIAGLVCRAGMSCVDDPSDSCDPHAGGRDCIGTCTAPPPPPAGNPTCGGIAGLTCPTGSVCVDDPSDSCDPSAGGGDCIGTCKLAPTRDIECGGFAGIACPSGLTCVDEPSDSCHPNAGGRDCSGVCRPTSGR